MNHKKIKFIFLSLTFLGLFGMAESSNAAVLKTVDFETGNTSQTSFDYGLGTIIPSDLPGGGNYAYRITIPAGFADDNCGFTIDVGDRPEIYARWYTKMNANWLMTW